MKMNEYSVQELKESEMISTNGGSIFLTGVIIGIMLYQVRSQ